MNSNKKDVVEVLTELNDTLNDNPILEIIMKLIMARKKKRYTSESEPIIDSKSEQNINLKIDSSTTSSNSSSGSFFYSSPYYSSPYYNSPYYSSPYYNSPYYNSAGETTEQNNINIHEYEINGKKYKLTLNDYNKSDQQIYLFETDFKINKFKNIYDLNNNNWQNIFEKEFIDQYNFYTNKNPSLDTSFDLFIDAKDVSLPNYTEKIIKDVDDLSLFEDENGQYNIFAVSLFMKPGAHYNDRTIQIGGMTGDEYFNKNYIASDGDKVWEKIQKLQNQRKNRDILTYIEILFQNIKLYSTRFPKWIIRLYTDDSISNTLDVRIKDLFERLKEQNIQIINCKFDLLDILDTSTGAHGGIATMLTRFFPMFDKKVKKFLTIEADNWPTESYFNLIEKWIDSDKLCISFISAYPYGWPSGEIIKIDGENKIVYFRQNYGGMFGLNKPKNKIYNDKFYSLLLEFANFRKANFNKNYFDESNNPLYPSVFYTLLKNKIKYLLDFGIDEVWLSLFIIPKISNYDNKSIFAIPVFGDKLNFNLLSEVDKMRILNKLKMIDDIKELDAPGAASLFNYINIENKNIITAIEIALLDEALQIDDYGLGIDPKYKDIFEPTFLNLYPGWDSSINYSNLHSTLQSIKDNNINTTHETNTFLIFKQKYLKYKHKYLNLKNKK
jgi:hypothetical protein